MLPLIGSLRILTGNVEKVGQCASPAAARPHEHEVVVERTLQRPKLDVLKIIGGHPARYWTEATTRADQRQLGVQLGCLLGYLRAEPLRGAGRHEDLSYARVQLQ